MPPLNRVLLPDNYFNAFQLILNTKESECACLSLHFFPIFTNLQAIFLLNKCGLKKPSGDRLGIRYHL